MANSSSRSGDLLGGAHSFLWAFLFMAHAHAAIFGTDDRVDVISSPAAYQLSHATAIAVLSSNFKTNSDGTVSLTPDSLSDLLCKDEKFSHDPSLSYSCTGFLVAPDMIATAGHCMVNVGESRNETNSYCQIYSWLFDYAADAKGNTSIDKIPAQKLVACEKVVYAIREETPPFRDFALVKLKHPLVDRKPLELANQEGQIGDSVSMIGYPLGSPAKLASHAKVLLNIPSQQSLITNLDAFEGNSGSPVFNSKGRVIGILTGGTPEASFKDDTVHQCERYNTCDEYGSKCDVTDKNDAQSLPEFQRTGSIVQKIAPVVGFLALKTAFH